MKYSIEVDNHKTKSISLHLKTLKKLNIENEMNIVVCVGLKKERVELLEHKGNEKVIYFGEDLYHLVSLPPFIQFEIFMHNNDLHIGPVIGLFVRGKYEEMTFERMKIYKKYLYEYSHIGGLILLFTTDGIVEEKKTILGFAYDPIKDEWEKGEYPFPSVVFIRKVIRSSVRGKLERLVGQNYFNSYVFDKLEMWKMFSNEMYLKKYFAETVLVNDFLNMKKLIDKHQHVYLKPYSGMQGTGIYQVKKNDLGFHVSYRLNGKNITTILDDWYSVEQFIRSEINSDKYIAQQGIPLIKDDGRIMDFRAIIIKEENDTWTVPGMVTKYGEQDSIVSNISSGGSAENVWDTLFNMFKGDAKATFKKYMEIENLALSCCKCLDKNGLHLAYIGIDIGIDKDMNLWVIEINNRSPDMTIALDAKDHQLYYKSKSAPLKYAKWLAGFGGI